MVGSGLKELLSSAYESVDKRLTGKKYLQNSQEFRMMTIEFLHSVVKVEAMNTSFAHIDSLSIKSRTTQKHWTDNVIKPVMITMLLSCATHESTNTSNQPMSL